jgi:membrane associated rhomboid family serine protease
VNSLIASGQLWRLATPALLHGDLLHLLVNCYSLNQVGPAAERLLGPHRFLCLYASSAVAGNVASFYLCPSPGVGSSGAIMGLVGSLAVYFARHRELHGRVGEARLECVASLAPKSPHAARCRSLTRVIMLNLLFGALSRNVDNWAHLGGLSSGALYAYAFGPNLVAGRNGRLVDRPLVPFLL